MLGAKRREEEGAIGDENDLPLQRNVARIREH